MLPLQFSFKLYLQLLKTYNYNYTKQVACKYFAKHTCNYVSTIDELKKSLAYLKPKSRLKHIKLGGQSKFKILFFFWQALLPAQNIE